MSNPDAGSSGEGMKHGHAKQWTHARTCLIGGLPSGIGRVSDLEARDSNSRSWSRVAVALPSEELD